jgi:hypothetical protein
MWISPPLLNSPSPFSHTSHTHAVSDHAAMIQYAAVACQSVGNDDEPLVVNEVPSGQSLSSILMNTPPLTTIAITSRFIIDVCIVLHVEVKFDLNPGGGLQYDICTFCCVYLIPYLSIDLNTEHFRA